MFHKCDMCDEEGTWSWRDEWLSYYLCDTHHQQVPDNEEDE